MREAVWTACVAAAYALGFISALLCLEVSSSLVSGQTGSEHGLGAAGLYGKPLRSLARKITMQSLFTSEAQGGVASIEGSDAAMAAAESLVHSDSEDVEGSATAGNATEDGGGSAHVALAGFHDDSDPREHLNFYIGIFTTAGGDYTARRRAIRETWLPKVNSFDDLQAHFVVGKARGLTAQRAMAQEKTEHNDFLELEMTDCYACLPEKTLQFFMVATARYSTNFILKIDDDVYLNPSRLRLAAKQWNAMPAEYIGCMHKGPVLAQKDDRDSKWFEPAGDILGKEYWLNAFGSIYAVSGLVADTVIAPNAARLRRLANEDTSMGLWMLAFDVAFFDDTRLCGRACDARAVSYWHIPCTGMCHPVEDTRLHHANANCSGPGKDPLPYIDSWEMNKHFHRLRKGVP